MVFESIVVDVLNRILGDYIENLDSKQLSIGIWGGMFKQNQLLNTDSQYAFFINILGDVVLQDLLLKQSALDDLNLPIQNVYGRLGNNKFKLLIDIR